MNPRVSVVIVAFNGLSYLPKLKEALDAQLSEKDEVLILDNNSTDGTADWIESNWSDTQLVLSDRNLLFVGGNNLLTRKARGEVVLYLNQDTVPAAGVVEEAARSAGPKTAVTFAQIFPWSGVPLIPWLDWSGAMLWRRPSDPFEPTSALSGGAFALHQDMLQQLGGVPFDVRMRHYAEDINLSLRIHELGMEIRAVSSVSVTHDSRPSTENVADDFRRAVQISRERLLAFAYAHGWSNTVRRLPMLLLAGFRKASVDGRWTLPRALGLTVATAVGYVWALFPRTSS
ncbi:MAG: glycosyltransferase [Gammaproteobacteria bacterium]|nr:glycosyltransferase [Gammaproteobacteria bacterium]